MLSLNSFCRFKKRYASQAPYNKKRRHPGFIAESHGAGKIIKLNSESSSDKQYFRVLRL